MTAHDPFEQLVDTILGGGGHRPTWGQQHTRMARSFNEKKFRKALWRYWGEGADTMRVRMVVQDAVFVAGVVHTVCEQLALGDDDQRRVATAVVRNRLLGEPDPSLDEVDAAWRAWWPPPPGEDARTLFAEFLGAWRAWLAHSPA